MHRHHIGLIKGLLSSILLTTLPVVSSCSKGAEQPKNGNGPAPAATSSSGGDFEGTIAMRMEGEDKKTMQMTYFLKGKQTRIETAVPDSPEGSAVMLWDNDGGKITTLMPSRKIYITVDMKQAA